MTGGEEAELLRLVDRAVEDRWEDGRKRARLQRVMAGRFKRMTEQTSRATLDGLRLADRGLYERFLWGCWRAMVRDGLISAGLLGADELRDLKARRLHEEHYGEPPPQQAALPLGGTATTGGTP